MKNKKRFVFWAILVLVVCMLAVTAFAAEEGEEPASRFYGTFWALVPPLVAIALALITKEAYSSLFIGILVGALLNANFNPVETLNAIVRDGFILVLSDSWNVGILLFLVILGIMVALINKAGGSSAFGEWALKRIKTKNGAMFSTFVLGVLIFVDDYFNCLTVGAVMRPVTDGHKISRAKLAYLIDATAAPVCMIAPISSWAAAVTGYLSEEEINGLLLFIKAIPYNFYSILTFVMIIFLCITGFDYGPMVKHEENAKNGDLFSGAKVVTQETEISTRGKVIDLILPVVILIICCVIGMIYTGGFFDGVDFVSAFSGCDAALGLSLGSIVALVIAMIYFMLRRVISFKETMDCIVPGFNSMVPPILILAFAWTLKTMTDNLGGDVFVGSLVEGASKGLMNMLPALIFIIACVIAFATGTSWGTIGILLPIVIEAFKIDDPLFIIAVSAVCAGAVCGDHCSPISDTTIMSSAGAQCQHINHVSTQLPYAITVAAVSFVAYIISGFVQNIWICMPVGIALMVGTLLVIKLFQKKVA